MNAEVKTESDKPTAWMEAPNGDRWTIGDSCALGRSNASHIVLPDSKVSRRHALIHKQADNEFWLVDLGSSNGTYVNGRRISQPTRLTDGDQIMIGEFRLVFRQPEARSGDHTLTGSEATLCEVRTAPYWLLLTDIIGSTQLAKRLPPDELSVVVGQWLACGKEIVERHHGNVIKYLGDGFMACWPQKTETESVVARALREFKEAQSKASPPFRLVAHFGEVALGGPVRLGEESFLGKEINRAFRLERLAASLNETCLLSGAAQTYLKTWFACEEIGVHQLRGFGQETVYRF